MKKNHKKECLLLLFSLGASLLFALGTIEIYYFTRTEIRSGHEFDTQLGWVNLKNRKYKDKLTYTTNSLGFRSEELISSKEKIIIIGDSVVFGLGVNDKETMSHYLGLELPDYQVLNLAVGGFGIGQYYLLLNRFINRIKPRLIVLFLCAGNDLQNTSTDESYGFSKPFFTVDKGTLLNINSVIDRYSCHNLFSTTWVLKQKPFSNLRGQFCLKRTLDIEGSRIVILAIFERISLLAEDNGSKVLFVLSPSKSNFNEKEAFLEFIENAKNRSPKNYPNLFRNSSILMFKNNLRFFRDIFQGSNFTYLDFLKSYPENKTDPDSLFIDHYHLSSLGNLELALAIKEKIGSVFPEMS